MPKILIFFFSEISLNEYIGTNKLIFDTSHEPERKNNDSHGGIENTSLWATLGYRTIRCRDYMGWSHKSI